MFGLAVVGEVFEPVAGFGEPLLDAQPEEPREPVGKLCPEDQYIICLSSSKRFFGRGWDSIA
jgi:hypothetical protein